MLLAVLSGCGGGGLRHESWPGLLVDGDTIFAANLERVQAFNAETGKLLWSYPDETDKELRPFYSTPVLAKDYGDNGLLLIAGYKDQTVYALELGESRAERPDLAWTFTRRPVDSTSAVVWSPVGCSSSATAMATSTPSISTRWQRSVALHTGIVCGRPRWSWKIRSILLLSITTSTQSIWRPGASSGVWKWMARLPRRRFTSMVLCGLATFRRHCRRSIWHHSSVVWTYDVQIGCGRRRLAR